MAARDRKLYDDLGVAPEATEAEIRAGYRRAAKAAHPDAPGGSPEKFESLSRALAILSDPLSRRRYDETGHAEETAKVDIRAQALQALDHVMASFIGLDGADWDHTSLLDAMNDEVDARIGKATADRMTVEAARKKFIAAAKRFKRKRGKKGDNVLARIATVRSELLLTNVRHQDTLIEVCEMMRTMLKEHTFDVDPAPPEQAMPAGIKIMQTPSFFRFGGNATGTR